MALSGLGIYLFSKNPFFRQISSTTAVVLFSLCILSMVFAGKQKAKRTKHIAAIVFSSTVTVKSSPDNSGTDLFVIHEGLKVQIKDEVGSWYNIRLADGNSGWVQKTVLEKI